MRRNYIRGEVWGPRSGYRRCGAGALSAVVGRVPRFLNWVKHSRGIRFGNVINGVELE